MALDKRGWMMQLLLFLRLFMLANTVRLACEILQAKFLVFGAWVNLMSHSLSSSAFHFVLDYGSLIGIGSAAKLTVK